MRFSAFGGRAGIYARVTAQRLRALALVKAEAAFMRWLLAIGQSQNQEFTTDDTDLHRKAETVYLSCLILIVVQGPNAECFSQISNYKLSITNPMPLFARNVTKVILSLSPFIEVPDCFLTFTLGR